MMFRLFLALAIVACTLAFMPATRMVRRAEVQMSAADIQLKISKALGVAAMGIALAGPMMPMPALADGAVSPSTVFRARNSYGARIVALAPAAASGDFAAFTEKKILNGFDLFISASNAQKSTMAKERKVAEKAIQAKIYDAVKNKDASKLKTAYDEFIKVADLTSNYKKGDVGQTDSSGFSPTWGTDRQYIYQR
ncbi:hypothetical protein B484DRAFT_452841 [Ochromonadaceae sp. CCMP2298]|nr:hypothetical protein B484DRAFT_452841 [Ochromonadaceae sp. CCMP2298]|eukprot:CAMPEP_0173241838 /NCGR_PEP_ID=MMETSP1142-20121109/14599_1 /TAXON_ID=483371 /ORGANISM="non described non described, Strain CCMP2298" /LENGTH=194 /DNA_ID=CAMNT_0014173225 /DNA_START=23 /DNA_END=607 /DNA_ORIENTATION=+